MSDELLRRADHEAVAARIHELKAAAARWEQMFIEAGNRAECAEDALRRNGFVPCDAPACNCGSWHARFGLPERMAEIRDALESAGHPLCNKNGNLPLAALRSLIAERDALREELANIAAADPRQWDEDMRDQFQLWAQNRARAALGDRHD